jgi:hypothetical protein
MWTLETRVEVTPLGRAAAAIALRERKPETRSLCDCGAPATLRYDGRRFCSSCVFDREEAHGWPCLTCDGAGVVPSSSRRNSELMTPCPDCAPVAA